MKSKLDVFNNLSHRELYAASKRAAKHGHQMLSGYLGAYANAKYAIEKNDALTGSYVELNRDVMNAFAPDAALEVSDDVVKVVLKQ